MAPAHNQPKRPGQIPVQNKKKADNPQRACMLFRFLVFIKLHCSALFLLLLRRVKHRRPAKMLQSKPRANKDSELSSLKDFNRNTYTCFTQALPGAWFYLQFQISLCSFLSRTRLFVRLISFSFLKHC